MNRRKGTGQDEWFRHMMTDYDRYAEEQGNEAADSYNSAVRRRMA